MTDDLISRKILIEKLGISKECVDCQHKLNGLCLWKPNMVDVCEVITEMPSAEPEQRWIPVTERLPKENGDYLVTGRHGAVNKRKYEDKRWYGNWAVIAWMPLPEPWKGEEDAEVY